MLTKELLDYLNFKDESRYDAYNELVKSVIETGNVNVQDDEGNTLLMYAIYSEDYFLCYLLIKSGADILILNEKNDDAYNLSLNYYKSVSTMIINSVKDVNTRLGQLNRTFLIDAVIAKHISDVELLIKMGADVTLKDDEGKTAYDYACLKDEKISSIIVEAMSDVNVKDKDGWTPLMWETHLGNIKNVILLLEKGADFNTIKDNVGETALDIAKRTKFKDAIFLFENVELLKKQSIEKLLEEDKSKTYDELLDEAKRTFKLSLK